MDKIIKYLKGLEKRTGIVVKLTPVKLYCKFWLGGYLIAYDFEIVKELKYNDCCHKIEGRITRETDLKEFKKTIAFHLPLRIRRK